MNFFLVNSAVVFVAIVCAQNFEELHKEEMEACMKETGVTKEDIRDHHKELASGHKVNDLKMNCFVKCTFTKRSLIDQDGNLDIEQFKEIGHARFSEEEKKVAFDCANKFNTIKTCEDMGQLLECFPLTKHLPNLPEEK